MPHPPETKVSTGQPNIQDVFLNYARRERLVGGHPAHVG